MSFFCFLYIKLSGDTMKNAINYYYHLNPDTIHQKDGVVEFEMNDGFYVLKPFFKTFDEFKGIYDIYTLFYQNSVYVHQIMPNIMGEYITNIEGGNYVLLRSMEKMDKRITIYDIIDFQNRVINIKNGNLKNDWGELWSKKIDYFEYQVNQFGVDFPLIRKSFNYFVGLAENGISAFNNFKISYIDLTVCHRRLKVDDTLYELYNPLNFIYDIKSRDFSEYFKNYFLNNSDAFYLIEKNLGLFNFNTYEMIMFFIRMLYPSFYFDLYESIIEKQEDEEKIEEVLKKTSDYEVLLSNIYFLFINYVKLPEIDWIKKVTKQY